MMDVHHVEDKHSNWQEIPGEMFERMDLPQVLKVKSMLGVVEKKEMALDLVWLKMKSMTMRIDDIDVVF